MAQPHRLPDIPAADFKLDTTLASGQSFRWRKHDDAYVGIVGATVLRVRHADNRLSVETSDKSFTVDDAKRYFGLDMDLAAVLRTIDVDAQVNAAIKRYRGLRVLNQDGWETLASFICSSFNNIKRIEGMIERLAQTYGDPVALNGFRSFSFPKPERIAASTERKLRTLGLGYRAAYLLAASRLVAGGRLHLDHMRKVDYDAAKTALLGCDGVGDKVADCVALFGCGKFEAFPIDVWMERAMRYYFRHRRMTRAVLHRYARQHFGPYAGVAQQYLFHYVRCASFP